MFTCETVGLDYLETAPLRLFASVNVNRPPSEVFTALAHDPANWGEFFPGFQDWPFLYTGTARRRLSLHKAAHRYQDRRICAHLG